MLERALKKADYMQDSAKFQIEMHKNKQSCQNNAFQLKDFC